MPRQYFNLNHAILKRFSLMKRLVVFTLGMVALLQTHAVFAMQVASGSLLRIAQFPSEYVQPKDVFIWLPEHYNAHTKFAVLYMHDAQMLFDATTTWNKQEWQVDEVASALMKSGKTRDFIVVASTNGDYQGGTRRSSEYFPQGALAYLSDKDKRAILSQKRSNGQAVFANGEIQSDNYLLFLTKELKPYIDRTFSVHTDAANTALMGSSMGGLISWYGLAEYPDVFGAAACISTHWPGAIPHEGNPLPKAFTAYLRDHLPKPNRQGEGNTALAHRIYFSLGTETLDKYYPPLQKNIDKLMVELGYTETHWQTALFEGDAHDEVSWAKRLPIAMTFLFGN